MKHYTYVRLQQLLLATFEPQDKQIAIDVGTRYFGCNRACSAIQSSSTTCCQSMAQSILSSSVSSLCMLMLLDCLWQCLPLLLFLWWILSAVCLLCFCVQPYFCITVCTFSKLPRAGIVWSIASRVVQVAAFSFLTFVCEKITLDSCDHVHNFCHSYGLGIWDNFIDIVECCDVFAHVFRRRKVSYSENLSTAINSGFSFLWYK